MLSDELIAALKQTDHAQGIIAAAALRERHGTDGFRLICSEIAMRDVPEAERPKFRFSGDYMAEIGTPLPMLVDRLLPDKSLILLTGKPKVGKSYVALQIMEDVEQGRAVFGKFHLHRKGTVCYLGMEDGDSEIGRRLKHRGHYPGEDRALAIYSDRMLLSTEEGVDNLRNMLAAFPENRRDVVLVVVDTARESLGIKDQNDAAQVGEALRPLRQFAHDTCTVLLVAHNRKQAGENAGDEIAGSGAMASSVDGWLSGTHGERLANGNRRIKFSVVGRGDMDTDFIVEMDTNTLAIRALTEDELCKESEQRHRAKRSEKYDRIIAAIETFPDAKATIKQIAEKLGEIGDRNTRTQVMAAVKDGVLEETQGAPTGRGKPPILYGVINGISELGFFPIGSKTYSNIHKIPEPGLTPRSFGYSPGLDDFSDDQSEEGTSEE